MLFFFFIDLAYLISGIKSLFSYRNMVTFKIVVSVASKKRPPWVYQMSQTH